MHQTPDGDSEYTQVTGRYRPEEDTLEGEDEAPLMPPNHSAGFDRALDRAMRNARLAPGTYHGKFSFEAEITVTNPPGITEYIVILSSTPTG
jgi:hypothetical protein